MRHCIFANPWLALLGLSLSSFLGCVDFTIVNTALPAIQSSLGATINQLQWIINIFMLTLTALMVVVGRLADIYGRRLVLYVGMAFFAVSSLGAGLASNIYYLIFFRLLQGIGISILYTIPIAIISDLFPENQRGKATGILIGANGFGLAIGPVIGGFIVSILSWRWIFMINLPIVLFSFLCCFKTVRESKSKEHGNKIDWYGFLLLIITLPAFILALVQGNVWGWDSGTIIFLFTITFIGCLLFYFVEKKAESPIIHFKFFTNQIFAAAIFANFALAFFYTVDFFLMPLYLHNIHLQTAYQIGLTILPATALVALLSPLVGYAVDKVGAKKVLLVGFISFTISALLQTYFSAQTSTAFIIFAFIFLGIGWACILSPSIVAALSSVPESISGVAIGTLGTLHNLGGAIGLAIGTVIYHYRAQIAVLTGKNNLVGQWIDQAIADPEHAVAIIQEHTKMNLSAANTLFQHFFVSGYNGAMWLLFLLAVIAFFIVLLGLRGKKNT